MKSFFGDFQTTAASPKSVQLIYVLVLRCLSVGLHNPSLGAGLNERLQRTWAIFYSTCSHYCVATMYRLTC